MDQEDIMAELVAHPPTDIWVAALTNNLLLVLDEIWI
jgi:hypothetical protein